MISCSSDKTIRVWNQNKSESKSLLGHTGSVFCIFLLDNGVDLVSGSFDKTIKIWNVKTGECKQTLENSSYIYCLNQLTPNSVISGSEDGSLKVWTLNDGTCQTIIYAHASLVTSIEVISSQSELILSSSTDTTIKMVYF
jgi:WD40 repeat protein